MASLKRKLDRQAVKFTHHTSPVRAVCGHRTHYVDRQSQICFACVIAHKRDAERRAKRLQAE